MGVSWHSHAEVISLEPEKIKELITEICEDKDYGSGPVYDLRIEDNSVFFNSSGYGFYGYDGDGYYLFDELLFKWLLERYQGAIACFEYVEPCQSQGYYFTTTWIKSEGVVDWYDEEICLIYKEGMIFDEYVIDVEGKCIGEDNSWDTFLPAFGEFDHTWVWSILPYELESLKDKVPHLYSLYKKYGNNEKKITQSLVYTWCDYEEISDDELELVISDCELGCLESIKDRHVNPFDEFQGELPDNFPFFRTESED